MPASFRSGSDDFTEFYNARLPGIAGIVLSARLFSTPDDHLSSRHCPDHVINYRKMKYRIRKSDQNCICLDSETLQLIICQIKSSAGITNLVYYPLIKNTLEYWWACTVCYIICRYVLTAAHCCDGSLGYFDVILGSQAQSQTEAHEFKTGEICYRATKMSSEKFEGCCRL